MWTTDYMNDAFIGSDFKSTTNIYKHIHYSIIMFEFCKTLWVFFLHTFYYLHEYFMSC